MIRSLLVIVAVIGIILLIRWLMRQPKGNRWQIAAVVAAIVLIGLAATGRANWFIAAFGAALPFLRRALGLLHYWPLINRLRSGEQLSAFATAYLEVKVDLQQRRMTGRVLQGQFAGSSLDALSDEQLEQLKQELKTLHTESYALLMAYLQFRGKVPPGAEQPSSAQFDRGSLSNKEAYAILGLSPGASKQEIIDAHRRLMQKLHPDRGGSSYLATQINQAKTTLLKQFI